MNRDLNAAINILKLRTIKVGTLEFTHVERYSELKRRSTSCHSMKQEPFKGGRMSIIYIQKLLNKNYKVKVIN